MVRVLLKMSCRNPETMNLMQYNDSIEMVC